MNAMSKGLDLVDIALVNSSELAIAIKLSIYVSSCVQLHNQHVWFLVSGANLTL